MMKMISKTSVMTALPYVGVLALGLVIGLIIPTQSKTSTAEFANAPVRIDAQTFDKKTRIIRVVEKPEEAKLACEESIDPEDLYKDQATGRFIYKGGKKVISKTCQAPEEKSAKMPNLFKK